MKRVAAALCLSTFCAMPASAATVEIGEWFAGQQVMAISGRIDPGDEGKIIGLTHSGAPRPDIILLTSPGGSVDAAERMALALNALDVPVLVRGDCASSCGFIALHLAHRLRVIGEGRVSVHQIFDENDVPDPEYTQRVIDVLKVHGVPDSVLRKIAETPPSRLSNISDAELIEAGADVDRTAKLQ
jgi:hypothetical protein